MNSRVEKIRLAAEKQRFKLETPAQKKKRLDAATAARCAAARAKAKGLPPAAVRAAAVHAYVASLKTKKPA